MDSPRDPLWQRYDEMMDYLVPPERLRQALKEAKERLAQASAPSQESVVGEEEVEAVGGYIDVPQEQAPQPTPRDFG